MNRKEWLRIAGLAGLGMGALSLKGVPLDLGVGYQRADFGPDFEWGVATAAYQIEGAWQADGKGMSIWDEFTRKKKAIHNNENGDVACDFYHSYPQDLALLKDLAVPNYRFSLAWSRILPNGIGQANEKGLDFYDRVIDTCLELGLKPWTTIYHWDLPQALQEKGGWTNRDVLNWFSEYANLVTKRYGDRVKDWMVLNEPFAFTGLGYLIGLHAPGQKGLFKFLAAVHHTTMCQAEGGRIIRANVPDANIGTTFSASHIMPVSDKPKHVKAAKRADALWNRLFLDPALGLGYPKEDFPALRYMKKFIKEGDEDTLAFDFDFIGLQNYTREVVKKAMTPFIRANFIKPEKRGVAEEDITLMGWEVYPEGIYHLLKKFNAYPQVKEILVTENGSAFTDELKDGRIKDVRRTEFLQNYIGQVLRAKQEGVKVNGYFIWTFLDNFEWAEGYEPRFGLVHVDFDTQKRTVKDSGLWFRDFLQDK